MVVATDLHQRMCIATLQSTSFRHLTKLVLFALILIPRASSFISRETATLRLRLPPTSIFTLNAQGDDDALAIDFQSDEQKFGRGDFHLSASLEDDDVICYQTGTWFVDGVQVGDASEPPSFSYARVDNVQVVWTHNCEHGVIRGVALEPLFHDSGRVSFRVLEEYVECGPEQLLAKIPVLWNDAFDKGESLVSFGESTWKEM